MASLQMLLFRSATLGYFDLTGNRRTENYGGIRPGCWFNAIPAGGLILMADAASRVGFSLSETVKKERKLNDA